ncbi:unnamed protein product [Spirodela intermedia]|uniref:Uncharacterized protein n=1 Tax=Spirodela intermedia TaxID=51605 RepID=A0A7I8JTT8_SPIIN|nr:unnamed protein product [Spirodela intermedia]CAA6673171.1 unnamed protein product [Spirodela intermedia]
MGACGFLALRASAPAPPSASGGQPSREIRELSQLLDAYDSLDALNEELGEVDASLQIQNRFMGLRAALFTAGSSVGSFARKLGFRLLEIDELVKKEALPVSEKSDVDLVVLHIRAGQELRALKDKVAINAGVDWLDGLVSTLLRAAQPGSEVAARLHFSVVNDSDLSLLRPCQSYCMKGGKRLDNIRHHHPMLVAQWQEGSPAGTQPRSSPLRNSRRQA